MVNISDLVQRLADSHPYESIGDISSVSVIPTARIFSREERAGIRTNWKDFVRKNPGAFAGPIVGYHKDGLKVTGRTLVVPIYLTDFAAYNGLKCTGNPVWTAGASGIVELHSEKGVHVPFGYRSPKTINVGGSLETVPQGFMKPDHLSAEDPFRETILDELEEELGITRDYLDRMFILHKGQVDSDDKNIYCNGNVTYVLRVDLTPQETRERFDALEAREHDRLDIVPKEELPDYVDTHFARLAVRTRHTLQDYFARFMGSV
jgi:8-oxo-dGTP pyrophosphatase MutT (NUDIX family)